MLNSFNTAISGINSNSQSINVIGNNLANINTGAYKTNRVSFSELLGGLGGTSPNGNPIQVGLGSLVQGVTAILSQGTVAATGRSTDVAINGSGYFIVSTAGGQAFTRAGNFGFNSEGGLISADGFGVMGYPAVNGVIDKAGALVPVVIAKGSSLPPNATADLEISANLDATTATNDTYSTGVKVFDSLGVSHNVTFTFTKTGASAWSWAATIPGADTGAAAPTTIGSGNFTFDSFGTLTAPASNVNLSISGLVSGAAGMTINFGILDAQGEPRFTSFAAESAVASTYQDGYSSSALRDINIASDGTVNGLFENGQVRPLYQLGIANFLNPEGLLKSSGSTFVSGPASGEPAIGTPGSGGRGTVTGAALEQSNVDITTEFTNLIISQRGFQANSKVISTTDELYQDTINMIR
jgi:flagellar hook protein FlgE